MATANKIRQPRLRASCDGCFLAKVKCSKARPICSRCLTNGIECRYSPSSRAGKPKASDTARTQQQSTPTSRSSGPSPVSNEGLMYGVNAGMTGVYTLDAGWSTPPTHYDEALSRDQSISSHGLPFMGVDNMTATDLDTGMSAGDMYGPTMPWTPPTDMSATFTDPPVATTMPSAHSRSHSYDLNSNTMSWVGTSSPEMFSFNHLPTPPSMTTNYYPSPTTTPNMRPLPAKPASTSFTSTGGSCICFTVCLQSLQALHNASSPSPPPFDLVLALNRKAVEGCAAMLGKSSMNFTTFVTHTDISAGCTRCMRRSDTHTAAMLLATVLGTITTFYKNASQSYFDSELPLNSTSPETGMPTPTSTPNLSGIPGLGVSLGAYTVNGQDSKWLELEILGRELHRLDEVYSNFREVCSELSEDPEVSKAMIGYLGQNLGSTIRSVTHRKGDGGYL